MPSEHDFPAASPGTRGLTVSLLFWACLLAAGGMFAAATLAPKLVSLKRREAELLRVSARVIQLAESVNTLEQHARALTHDEDFIAARARRQLGLPLQGEVMLPASDSSAGPSAAPDRPTSTEELLLLPLAMNPLLRSRLLLGAAALVLFAFTFLHTRDERLSPS